MTDKRQPADKTMRYILKQRFTNAGPVTLNGLSIMKDGKPLMAGDIKEGEEYTVTREHGEDTWELGDPG